MKKLPQKQPHVTRRRKAAKSATQKKEFFFVSLCASLGECCGSTAWVEAMIARRPFVGESALLDAADEIWWKLSEADWREAFAHHPQIGDEGGRRGWSQDEQVGMRYANPATRSAIAERNRAYLEKFGYIYIVCATGKTSDEMLSILEERLKNHPTAEIRVAADEQRKITGLPWRRLLFR